MRGDLSQTFLAVLAEVYRQEKPFMRSIEEAIRMTSGREASNVRRTLWLLEQRKYLKGHKEKIVKELKPFRVYEVTPKGEKILKETLRRLERLIEAIGFEE